MALPLASSSSKIAATRSWTSPPFSDCAVSTCGTLPPQHILCDWPNRPGALPRLELLLASESDDIKEKHLTACVETTNIPPSTNLFPSLSLSLSPPPPQFSRPHCSLDKDVGFKDFVPEEVLASYKKVRSLGGPATHLTTPTHTHRPSPPAEREAAEEGHAELAQGLQQYDKLGCMKEYIISALQICPQIFSPVFDATQLAAAAPNKPNANANGTTRTGGKGWGGGCGTLFTRCLCSHHRQAHQAAHPPHDRPHGPQRRGHGESGEVRGALAPVPPQLPTPPQRCCPFGEISGARLKAEAETETTLLDVEHITRTGDVQTLSFAFQGGGRRRHAGPAARGVRQPRQAQLPAEWTFYLRCLTRPGAGWRCSAAALWRATP